MLQLQFFPQGRSLHPGYGHPCSNALTSMSVSSGYRTERLNQELGWFLRSYCSVNQADWSRFLPWAEYAKNSLTSSSTVITPFQCVLGFQPPLFPWSGETTTVPAVDDWLKRSEEVWQAAHVRLQRAVRGQKIQADRRRRKAPIYQPGKRVWLAHEEHQAAAALQEADSKYRDITPRQVG